MVPLIYCAIHVITMDTTRKSTGMFSPSMTRNISTSLLPVKNVFECSICVQWCRFPVLFPCGDHYFCAECIRTWIASQALLTADNQYDFTVTCPMCRYSATNMWRALMPAASGITDFVHKYVPHAKRNTCPFCHLEQPSKEHVACCNEWLMMCRTAGCNKIIKFKDLEMHVCLTLHNCSVANCMDGINLSNNEFLQHMESHEDFNTAMTRLLKALDFSCDTTLLRKQASEIIEECSCKLIDLHVAIDDIHDMTDVEDTLVDAPIQQFNALSVEGINIDTLVNTIQTLMEIETRLRHGRLTVEQRAMLRRDWRKIDDLLPKLKPEQWALQYLNVYTHLPLPIRVRILTPVFGPPGPPV